MSRLDNRSPVNKTTRIPAKIANDEFLDRVWS